MPRVRVMVHLVRFEYKKLFRSHLNKFMLLLLLIVPCLGIMMGLSNARVDPLCMNGQSLYVEGKGYCGVAQLAQQNQALHQYAGEMDAAWFEDIEQSLHQEQLQANKQLVMDEVSMQATYGDGWKALIQEYPDGQVPWAVYERFFPSNPDDKETIPMQIHYTQASMEARNSVDKLFPNIEKEVILHPYQYLLSKEGFEQEQAYYSDFTGTQPFVKTSFLLGVPSVYDEAYYAYLNTKFLHYDAVYEAQVGVSLFMNIMEMNWLLMSIVMIFLGIILVQLFNQEYSSKSDQLLKPTQIGSKSQAHAKLWCGGSLSILITLYMILVYLLFIAFSVGFYDMSSTFVVLGERTMPYLFTCWELILTSIALMLVGMFTCYALLMPLAMISKTSFQGLLYVLAFVILLFAGGNVVSAIGGDQGYLAYVKNFSPFNFMATPYLFTLSHDNVQNSLMHLSLGSTFIPIAYVYILFWLPFTGIALWWTQHSYKKRNIENA